VEKNEKLDSNPDLINKDPYGEGWMIKIEIANPSEFDELLSPEQYQAQLG